MQALETDEAKQGLLSLADCVPRILWWMLWPTAATRTINQCQWEAMSIWLPKTTENTPSHRLWSAWMKECFFCLCGLTRQQCCWPFPTCKTSSQQLSSQLRCSVPQKAYWSLSQGEKIVLYFNQIILTMSLLPWSHDNRRLSTYLFQIRKKRRKRG